MYHNAPTLAKLTAIEQQPIRRPMGRSNIATEGGKLDASSRRTTSSTISTHSVGARASEKSRSSKSSQNLHNEQNLKRSATQPSKPKANLGDLSDLLQLRGRLQEMGAIFSSSGELLFYGNPFSHAAFEEMLRLGPFYDELWCMIFAEGYVPSEANEDGLWSDLRTLKKVLLNHGVRFNEEHARLMYDVPDSKTRRLCDAYDVLYQQWNAAMELRLPVSGAIGRRNSKRGYSRGSRSKDGDAERALSIHPALRTGAPRDDTRKSGSSSAECAATEPRNIGWRFSGEAEALPSRESPHKLDEDPTTSSAATDEGLTFLEALDLDLGSENDEASLENGDEVHVGGRKREWIRKALRRA